MFYGILGFFKSLFIEKLFYRTGAEYMLFTLVVGYFANAQYDVLFLHVILNDSEESHRRTDNAYTLHFSRGIFRCAKYDVKKDVIAKERSDCGNPSE